MRFDPARLIGAGLLVLAGILALAATELARVTLIAAGRSTTGVGIEPLGWICVVLGAGMFILEYWRSWIRSGKE
jgi:hypothetical protein